MRYAFMGPMETIHLNAEGTQNYCDRYGEVRAKNPSCVSMIPNKFMKMQISNLDSLVHRQYTMSPRIWVRSPLGGNKRRRRIRPRWKYRNIMQIQNAMHMYHVQI